MTLEDLDERHLAIPLHDLTGRVAESGEIPITLAKKQILPAIKNKQDFWLDFAGVYRVSDGFLHQLLFAPLREYGAKMWDYIHFIHCDDLVNDHLDMVQRMILEIPTPYFQTSYQPPTPST